MELTTLLIPWPLDDDDTISKSLICTVASLCRGFFLQLGVDLTPSKGSALCISSTLDFVLGLFICVLPKVHVYSATARGPGSLAGRSEVTEGDQGVGLSALGVRLLALRTERRSPGTGTQRCWSRRRISS